MNASAIPPVSRSVSVSWDPEAAFRRFTDGFGTWWPRATHSIGGGLVQRIDFECRVGGLIVEELKDGRRFQWGKVTAWEPPRRVAFTWHPSRDEAEAQDVEVCFVPEGTGTRVELVSHGWEKLGTRARVARRAYNIGWGSVLDTFAGRTSAAIVCFSILSRGIGIVLQLTGRREASIEGAGGRLAPISSSSAPPSPALRA
jgi:uncharacterized protein YndB with AHSA1/START domain